MRRRFETGVVTLLGLTMLVTAAAMGEVPGKLMPATPSSPPVPSGQQALQQAGGKTSDTAAQTGGQKQGPGFGCELPSKDPIGIIRGSALRHEVDIEIPCPLIDLEFHRYYNSAVKYTGPLGAVWCHSYDWRLYQVTQTNYEESPPEVEHYLVLQAISDPNAGPYSGMFHWFRGREDQGLIEWDGPATEE